MPRLGLVCVFLIFESSKVFPESLKLAMYLKHRVISKGEHNTIAPI